MKHLVVYVLLILSIIICGCSNTPANNFLWHEDMPGYRVQNISVSENFDINRICNEAVSSNILGCVIRNKYMAEVYIKSGLDNITYKCVFMHEMRHVSGDTHTGPLGGCGFLLEDK